MPDTPPQPATLASSIVVGFDYGLKYVGVATGNRLTCTATPLAHLRARDGVPVWREVEALLQEWQPGLLIVGLPLNMDGSESEMSRRTRRFANRLHGRFGLQVSLQDERLSSYEAKSLLGGQVRHGGRIDSLAASLIVEQWLAQTGS